MNNQTIDNDQIKNVVRVKRFGLTKRIEQKYIKEICEIRFHHIFFFFNFILIFNSDEFGISDYKISIINYIGKEKQKVSQRKKNEKIFMLKKIVPIKCSNPM